VVLQLSKMQNNHQGPLNVISMTRVVSQELVDALGPFEKLIAMDYLRTGHWILKNEKEPRMETSSSKHRSELKGSV
jgi:hypothetical protein